MLLESLYFGNIQHLWGLDLLGLHFLIIVIVLIEVLENKRGAILSVTNVLLYILNLLNQEELVLLCQIIQVQFIREVYDRAFGGRLVILFFLEVVDLVCKLLLELLKDIKGLEVSLVGFSLELGQSII